MAQFDGRIIWRVQSTDSDARSKTFDALILSNDPALRPALGPPRLIGIRTPFEKELPDGDVTLIVRATDATVPLVSECDVLDSAGQRRVYGRSSNHLAVFVCSKSGITVTGLPEPGSGPDSPAA